MLLLDGDQLLYLVGFASQKKDKETNELVLLEENVVLNMVDNKIFEWAEKSDQDDITVFLSGSDNFRYKVAKQQPYKGNRKDIDKPFYFNLIKDYLINDWNAVISNGWEADDEISIAQYAAENKHIVCSSDKDLKQCEGVLYLPELKREGKVVREDTYIYIDKDYSHYWLCYQMLVGDTADNIKGVEGIGEAKAKKYLNELDFKERQEVVKKLYDYNKDLLQEKGNLLYILKSPEDYFDVEREIW